MPRQRAMFASAMLKMRGKMSAAAAMRYACYATQRSSRHGERCRIRDAHTLRFATRARVLPTTPAAIRRLLLQRLMLYIARQARQMLTCAIYGAMMRW